MTENPYASPAAAPDYVPQTDPSAKQPQIASQGKRFANLIIDNIVIQIASAGVGFVLGIVFAMMRMDPSGTLSPADEVTLQITGFILGMLTAVGYFILMEGTCQRTLGKFVTGTIVVTAGGARPSFGQIVGRSFARMIPFEAFSFLVGKRPVGWHDSLSGTRVVDLT